MAGTTRQVGQCLCRMTGKHVRWDRVYVVLLDGWETRQVGQVELLDGWGTRQVGQGLCRITGWPGKTSGRTGRTIGWLGQHVR